MPFVDTNVLLYAVSRDEREAAKAARARELLRRRDLTLSAQVLQEFYVQATRPTRPDPLSGTDAADLVAAFGRFPVCDITPAIVAAAITTHQRFRLSYWDAAILETARACGCDAVLSEDLDDATDYAGVRVENPFSGM